MDNYINKSKEQLIEEILKLRAEVQQLKGTNVEKVSVCGCDKENDMLDVNKYDKSVIDKQLLKIQKREQVLNKSNSSLNKKKEELKNTQMKLIHSEKMASLGVLTAGIAHEINNPINFISMGISCLREDLNDIISLLNLINTLNKDNYSDVFIDIEELKQDVSFDDMAEVLSQTVEHISTGINRTLDIVKGLQKFSHADTEDPSRANIHESIDTALILFNSKFKEKIRIVKQYDDKLPSVMCYPGKLGQVFVNIISNAIDAIDGLGMLTIKTSKAKGYVMISISDTGKGITEEVKEKLFEPFFTTKAIGKGTGLGLSISYEIITGHNGNITVNSTLGQGSEFIISLPIQNELLTN